MTNLSGHTQYPRLSEDTLLLPDRPAAWSAQVSVPTSVFRAEDAFLTARDVLQKERSGFSADLTFKPAFSILKRDDPPRPAVTSTSVSPTGSLSWRPLRSEVLLAEARVFEAFSGWLESWRDVLVSTWIAPVRLAQAKQENFALQTRIAALKENSAEDDVESLFELWEVELDQKDALITHVEAYQDALRLVGSNPREQRFPVTVKDSGSLAMLPAYRATMLRAAAVVARSERRRLAAVMPSLSLAMGLAGSRARAEAEFGFSHGRPEAFLKASLNGTPQERAWASLEASFRLGTDLGEVEQDVLDARQEVQREHDAFVAAHEEEVRGRRDAWRRADEHWRLAEDRLAWLQSKDDPSERDVEKALREVRTWWIRMVVAAGRLSESWATWPNAD